MNAIDALLRRRSVPARYLSEPGPSADQIAQALDVALRAPDHGQVRPWRFRLVQGAARAVLAERLVACALQREPALGAEQQQKIRGPLSSAPLAIVVSARLKAHPKVPEIEQLLSAGAGVMNLLNAFALQGFGAIWLTGANTYDPAVAVALGLDPAERLLGFIYVGTASDSVPPAPPRPERAGFVSTWPG